MIFFSLNFTKQFSFYSFLLHRACFFFSPASFFICYHLLPLRLATQTHNKHKHKQTKKQKNQYDLTLVASDSLNESVTRVVILIKDSNDLPPIFNQTMYTAHALEELADPLPFKLLQVASTPQLSPDLIQLFFLSFLPPKKKSG
jgi:hypothetical protein